MDLVNINQEDELFWMPINKPKQIRVTVTMMHKEEQNASEYKSSTIDRGTHKNNAMEVQLWRRSMGQASMIAIRNMMGNAKYIIRPWDEPQYSEGETCTYAKQTKASTVRNVTGNTQNITIHMGICGPIR